MKGGARAVATASSTSATTAATPRDPPQTAARSWSAGTSGGALRLRLRALLLDARGRVRAGLHRQHRRLRLLVRGEQRQARVAAQDRRLCVLVARRARARAAADRLHRLLRRQALRVQRRVRRGALERNSGGKISGGADDHRRPRLLLEPTAAIDRGLGARTGQTVWKSGPRGVQPGRSPTAGGSTSRLLEPLHARRARARRAGQARVGVRDPRRARAARATARKAARPRTARARIIGAPGRRGASGAAWGGAWRPRKRAVARNRSPRREQAARSASPAHGRTVCRVPRQLVCFTRSPTTGRSAGRASRSASAADRDPGGREVRLRLGHRGLPVVEDRGAQRRVGAGLAAPRPGGRARRRRPRRSRARRPPPPPPASARGRSRPSCRRGPCSSAGSPPRRARRPRAPTRPRRARSACGRRRRRPPSRRRPRGAFASIASTTHCAPNRSASSSISSGRATAAELTETLSAPASSTACASSTRADAAADRERDEDVVGGAPRELDDRVALLVRGGDVEEDELVRALGVVALGQLHRVAGVAQVDEVRALHDAPAVDVEARDDALVVHASQARQRL